MSVTAGVSDVALATRDKLNGKINPKKVKFYWPGKSPEWANEADEDGDIKMSKMDILEKTFPSHDGASDPALRDNPRLPRLAVSRIDNRNEASARPLENSAAEIVGRSPGWTRIPLISRIQGVRRQNLKVVHCWMIRRSLV
ncbi:unnamed protein product [Linum trigynum]|uniref:Uncharacterized protein n=1 Tax=Linum trigynum TaxID=586398 RepID=A0AAV2EA15_9ROSI